MFAMMEMTDAPKVGMRERIRRGLRGYSGVSAKLENVLGVEVLRVGIESPGMIKQAAFEKRIGLTIGLLRQRGIRHLCFAYGFPYEEIEIFARAGFAALERDALYESLACEIAVKAAVERKAAALFARRVTVCVERALLGLCANFRYVMVDIESGGAAVCRNLRRDCGVSIIEKPSQKQLAAADVALFFSQPVRKVKLPDKCVAAAVTNKMLQSVELRRYVSAIDIEIYPKEEKPLPAEYSREILTSAAVSAGVLRGNNLILRNIKIDERRKKSPKP